MIKTLVRLNKGKDKYKQSMFYNNGMNLWEQPDDIMKQSDFESFQEVRPHMADRKTNTDGEKISWLKIQSMEWRLRKRLISKRKEEGTQ